MVGQNQTAIDPNTLALLARGQGSAPVGNTVFNPSVGGAQPTVQQQGQFPPSRLLQNPGADLGHLATALAALQGDMTMMPQEVVSGGRTNTVNNPLIQSIYDAMGQSTRALQGTNAPTSGEGQTATNPKTGERRIFKGGQWIPLSGPTNEIGMSMTKSYGEQKSPIYNMKSSMIKERKIK